VLPVQENQLAEMRNSRADRKQLRE